MKFLFLDIDGVMNRCGKSAQGLEEVVRRLNGNGDFPLR